MKVINVPYSFQQGNVCEFIQSILDELGLPKDNEFIFDLTSLSFIRPSGVTIFSNIIEYLQKNNVRVDFVLPKYSGYQNSPVKFLDDSLFFERYLGKKLFESSHPRSTTVPLKLIGYEQSFFWLENDFIRWLSNRLYLTEASLVNIKLCVIEIFNNIRDHSGENIGCVFAQHFPREHQVKIAISDFGVGIPTHVRQSYPQIEDSQAILKATEEGFTTKSVHTNAGAGLDILISNVVSNNKGGVLIYSHRGQVSCSWSGGRVVKDHRALDGFYPGTFLYITLRTDTIENVVDIAEDFEWF